MFCFYQCRMKDARRRRKSLLENAINIVEPCNVEIAFVDNFVISRYLSVAFESKDIKNF